jgi:hypothetical protein
MAAISARRIPTDVLLAFGASSPPAAGGCRPGRGRGVWRAVIVETGERITWSQFVADPRRTV